MNGTSSMIFTLPSGEVKTLTGLSGWISSNLTFHSQLRVTDEYLNQMRTYYLLENEETYDLLTVGTNVAGKNTYWTYDESTKTLEISGNGSLAATTLWSQLGITEISTIILGAGVNRLMEGSLPDGATIVDLHGEMDEIIVDDDCLSATTWGIGYLVIYSDNISLRRDDIEWCWGGAIIEWHSLSEWQPEAKMYSYNGVVLPKLPEWDRETYPFAVVVCVEATQWTPRVYYLLPNDTPFDMVTDIYSQKKIVILTDRKCWKTTDGVVGWEETESSGFYDLIWTNHYIYDTDGTLYLAATDPIPVYE
jgi:hypothetical protein